LFDSCLQPTPSGSRYVEEGGRIPSNSVGFWRLPWRLFQRRYNDDGRVKHRYVAAKRYGFSVTYVGLANPIEVIPRGSLVRVSLARWHQFPDQPSRRCWLQLSGWHLPGQQTQNVNPDQSAPRVIGTDDDIPF
jgi:hypothetical protein